LALLDQRSFDGSLWNKPLGDDLNPSLVKIQSNVSNLSISSFEADPTGSSIS